MLLFSTILPIKDTMTKAAFVQLVIDWNNESSRTGNKIPDVVWNGELPAKYGDENLWLDIQEYRNQNIVAVRYEKKAENGMIWDTDYVMNFNEMRMSVRLERSYLEGAFSIDPGFSTPHFITYLINNGYIVGDGVLPVLRDPILITAENLELVSDVINGKTEYRLPVVYVSRTFYDEDPVEIGWLASRLKGVAHVLVQESNITNAALRDMCDSKNEYYGAIGIYYPNKNLGHRRFVYRDYEGSDKVLLEKVIRAVIEYCNAKMVNSLYTWQGVSNALLRDRLAARTEELQKADASARIATYQSFMLKIDMEKKHEEAIEKAKAAAKADAEELIQAIDLEMAELQQKVNLLTGENKAAEEMINSDAEEMAELQRKVEELTRANEALTWENQGIRAKLQGSDSAPIMYLGEEEELFPDEIRAILLDALELALPQYDQQLRRKDVIESIIKANDCPRPAEERAEQLKNAFKGYKKMGGSLKRLLQDMGFIITEDGKHYKLTYYGDPRYWTTIAKTGSDGHDGMNAALTIIREMF